MIETLGKSSKKDLVAAASSYKAFYYLFKGDFAQAIQASKDAIANGAENLAAYYFNYGSILMALGRYEEGFEKYETSVNLQSTNLFRLKSLLNYALLLNDETRFRFWLEKYNQMATSEYTPDLNGYTVNLGNRKLVHLIRGTNKLVFKKPLLVQVVKDDGDYYATCDELPAFFYGSGETIQEAHDMFLSVIDEIYEDLQKDDDFSEDFFLLKKQLLEMVELESA